VLEASACSATSRPVHGSRRQPARRARGAGQRPAPQVINVLQLLGDAEATVLSDPFTYTGATPNAVRFSLDARTESPRWCSRQGLPHHRASGRRGRAHPHARHLDALHRRLGVADAGGRSRSRDRRDQRHLRLEFAIEAQDTLSVLSNRPAVQLDNIRLSVSSPDGGTDTTPTRRRRRPPRSRRPRRVTAARQTTTAPAASAPHPSFTAPRTAALPGPADTIRLTRQQLVINQRISAAGVRRVNTVLDRLQAGLTSADFQACSIGADRFPPPFARRSRPSSPAARSPAFRGRGPHRPARQGDNSAGITLSRLQLITNQRISAAAVRRVNAITARMKAGLSAGDFRIGGLTRSRSTAAAAAPSRCRSAAGHCPRPSCRWTSRARSPRTQGCARQPPAAGHNQRISAAAVRRINAIQAQFDVGLTARPSPPAHCRGRTCTRRAAGRQVAARHRGTIGASSPGGPSSALPMIAGMTETTQNDAQHANGGDGPLIAAAGLTERQMAVYRLSGRASPCRDRPAARDLGQHGARPPGPGAPQGGADDAPRRGPSGR